MTNFLREIFDVIRWSALDSLSLYGDHINNWIILLTSVDFPQLTNLEIRGTDMLQQQLSHSSVLFVQRLLESIPLEELHIRNIQSQNKQD